MSSYAYTQSRIFQWIGILLALGIIATGYYYFRASAGVKTSTLMPSGSLTSGLVGYWPFDRASVTGTTAQDRSTNKFNGTLSGGPSIVAGTIHEAIDLDGTNDLVSMGDQASLDVGDTGDFSVSGWFSRDTFTTDDVIVAKVNGTGSGETGYVVYIDDATDQLILKVGDGVDTYFIASTTTFTSVTWVHFVVVWDQDSASGTTMYLNGAAASNGASGNIDNINDLSNALAFHVGQTQAGSDYFDGKLDEIRFYNRVLTASEVATLYSYTGEGVALNSSISQPQGTGRLDSGLAGYWKLDDGSGTSAADTSTNGNTGTLTNGPTWTTGQIGGAVSFDGTDDYVTITDSDALTPQKISIAFWSKSDVTSSQPVYVHRLSDSSRVDIFVGSSLYCTFGNGTTYNTGSYASTWDTNWHHVVCMWDGTTVLTYLDGTLVKTEAFSGTLPNVSASVNIGRRSSTSSYFDGKIDEVRLYNRALSVDEVSQLYRLTSPTGVDTSLKGYWSFNGSDISGTTAYDRSGSGLNGTLTSGPTVTKGRVGQALDFDGTDDYVTITDADDTKYTGAITLCTWAKIDTGSTYRHFMGKHASNGATQNPFDFRTTSDTIPLLVLVRANTDSKNWTGPAVTLGAWKYYCVTAPSAIESAPTFYIDGVAAVPPTAGGTGTGTATGSGAAIRIGVRSDSVVRMDGSMDEVRIYNRALSAAEIKSLYDTGESDKSNTSASQPQGTGRLDSGLAGYWKLDDGSGTSATDSSTNGNTGTLTNGPTWTTGQIGGAVDFDGTDDYIGTADYSFSSTQSFTMSLWFNVDTVSGNQVLLSKSSVEFSLKLTGSALQFSYWNLSSSDEIFLSQSGLNAGQWYHVMITYDGIGTAYMYLNGILVNTDTSVVNPFQNRSHVLQIGGGYYSGGNSEYFNGKIDEVRIYNRALSADEVSQLYRLTSPTGVDTSLKGYWSFNGPDISGTTAYDRSGTGNNGTLTNGPTKTIGKVGQALDFDGTDDYVTIADIAFGGTNPISVCAWANSDSLSTSDTIVSQGVEVVLRINDADATKADFILNTFSTNDRITVTHNMVAGQWYYLCGTYASGGNLSLFIDGILMGSVVPTGSYGNDASAFIIGDMNGYSRFWDGKIDEVRIYNRALSAAEIKSLYNQGR